MPRLAILCLITASAYGQTSGQITGTVQDKSGAVVPTAAITAVNELTGLVFRTTSDPSGRFTLLQLPVGDYRVDITRDGFRPFRSPSFRLDADSTRQVQASLELGQVSE